LLEVKKIYHYYGKAKALEDVSLKVENKSLDGVIGPNGAGKTTLLRTISGLEDIDRGQIMFRGERIDELEPYEIARRGIAHCPERRHLFSAMSVTENLQMGAYGVKDKGKIKSMLKLVFKIFPVLEQREKQIAGTLSGGEQQMLAIARALMANPKLLLMDEPSLGLAPKIKTRIFEAINEIKKTGTTTLLVEQDAVLAMEVADNLNVLEEGKIEMRGTPKELRKEPRMREVYLGME
jgi:branched-chain amino acid transport system ATP-binding protein